MPTLCLILLAMLSSAALPSVSTQYIQDDTTRNCARISTKLRFRNGNFDRRFDSEYESSMRPFASSRQCPYDTVCAQKLTVVEGQETTYSEDCWDLSTIIEYTEVACYTNLCNDNLTFASFPAFRKSYFRSDSRLRCYNHGQLTNMNTYTNTISENDYRIRSGSKQLPKVEWNGGMCGAAIYASGHRTRVTHERVITGDRQQKFALLRVCPRYGCDRSLVRNIMSRGFSE